MDLRERVQMRMSQLGLNPFQVCKRMGLKGNGTLWSFLHGRTKSFRRIPELATALETSVDWLSTGHGRIESDSSSGRPYVEPDPKYQRILALCLREWRKPPYNTKLDEKVVLEIARTIYEQTKTSHNKQQIASQAAVLMAHSARKIKSSH